MSKFFKVFLVGTIAILGGGVANVTASYSIPSQQETVSPIFSVREKDSTEAVSLIPNTHVASDSLVRPKNIPQEELISSQSPAPKISPPFSPAPLPPEPMLIPEPIINTEVPSSVIPDPHPARISIPTINLNAPIIDVGITGEGNLDVPNNFTQVGWYKYGPLPGEQGVAVLDAHVDNAVSIPGPFKHLRELKVGDEIIVIAKDGTPTSFKVTESNVYRTNQFPAEEVFHGGSGNLLKLITCHGIFVSSEGTYDQRLVVTAVRI
jgi:LPXTG-site transpeptidase (sortase) family protein